LTIIFIVVAVFFVAAVGIMVRTEAKSTERREIDPLGPPPKKRRAQTFDGTYILK
jgi:amino acid transporter